MEVASGLSRGAKATEARFAGGGGWGALQAAQARCPLTLTQGTLEEAGIWGLRGACGPVTRRAAVLSHAELSGKGLRREAGGRGGPRLTSCPARLLTGWDPGTVPGGDPSLPPTPTPRVPPRECCVSAAYCLFSSFAVFPGLLPPAAMLSPVSGR